MCLENIAEEIRHTFCHGSISELFIPSRFKCKMQPGCVVWGSCGTMCKFVQCSQPKTIVVELRSNTRQNNTMSSDTGKFQQCAAYTDN